MAKRKSKFRRRLPLVGIFLLLITGICFFMYPIIGSWYTEYTAKVTIERYDETVQKMGNASLDVFAKQAAEYNELLSKSERNKVSALNYNNMLAVTDAIGYIEIPIIGVYYPIYHGLAEEMLQKGIGHMEGTSLPIGGKSTHCVLAGHTGLPSSKMFTDLDTVKIGDDFYIHVLNRVLHYRVDQILVVLPNQSDAIRIVDGEDYVTLVTCTPYGVNDHRLLVRGRRIIYYNDEGVADEDAVEIRPIYRAVQQQTPARTILWYVATGVVIVVLVGVIAILVFPSSRRSKRSRPAENTSDSGGESGHQ
ncbi:MAG: class C sortase [Acutalibacteraceae bacterium]|nr:class C sortase [Acutalibacteraceae bacterium]HCA56166.1 class C sortase [Oscillospiraceae bacterium]